MSGETILTVDKLRKSFGGVMALHDVDFELRQGDFLGIIGPNGAGKTTLVNLITGFVRPDGGRVLFRGKNITRRHAYQIANLGVARTFQMVRLFYNLPAYKNLVIPLCSERVKKLRGGKYGERDDAAIDLLDDMGFERDSYVPYKAARSLPHGYLKRLDLASVLPLIEKLNDQGLTIVMIEHRLRELFRIVNRVLVLNFGLKIAEGLPDEVMDSDAVKKAYLGVDVEIE